MGKWVKFLLFLLLLHSPEKGYSKALERPSKSAFKSMEEANLFFFFSSLSLSCVHQYCDAYFEYKVSVSLGSQTSANSIYNSDFKSKTCWINWISWICACCQDICTHLESAAPTMPHFCFWLRNFTNGRNTPGVCANSTYLQRLQQQPHSKKL